MSVSTRPQPASGLSRLAALAVVTGVVGAGALLGRRNAPDPSHPGIRRWYKRLDKPATTPPDPVFAAVWPALEVALAAGGYRLLRQPRTLERDRALALWLLNTSMIGGWTELFFRRHSLGASTAASGLMVATGAGYVAAAARIDRPSAVLGTPFVAWLSLATLITGQVWRRNPRPART